jgi:hypothetical protein
MVREIKGLPVFWNNYALILFCENIGVETAEEGMTIIATDLAEASKRGATVKAMKVLGKMFNAAVAAGHLMQNKPIPSDPMLGYELITEPGAIKLLFEMFKESQPRPKAEENEGK